MPPRRRTPPADSIIEPEEDKAVTTTEHNVGTPSGFTFMPAEEEPGEVHAVPMGAGVHRKLLDLSREVERIGKEHRATHSGGNYAYRGVDDAMDAVGAAMRNVGLIGRTNVLSKEVTQNEVTTWDDRKSRDKVTLWTTVRVDLDYTFTDPDDGTEYTYNMIGEGRDAGDKATGKAISVAYRDGLLKSLVVPIAGVSVDVETEHPEVSYRRDRPAQTPAASEAPRTASQGAQYAFDATRRPGFNLETLDTVEKWAKDEGLLDQGVDSLGGVKLGKALMAVRATLQEDQESREDADYDDGSTGDVY